MGRLLFELLTTTTTLTPPFSSNEFRTIVFLHYSYIFLFDFSFLSALCGSFLPEITSLLFFAA